MVERLPPPPFWRTRYFADQVVHRPDRQEITDAHILKAVAQSFREVRQPDGRLRRWLWIEERQRWLRVVLEADGETVHNAFWDRKFRP